MENIRCTVERITYQNEENGWSVLRVNVKGYKDGDIGTISNVDLEENELSRAKKICVLIGQVKALGYAVKNLTME